MCKNIVLQQLLALFNNTAKRLWFRQKQFEGRFSSRGLPFPHEPPNLKLQKGNLTNPQTFIYQVCLLGFYIEYIHIIQRNVVFFDFIFFNLNTVQMSYYCDTTCFWSLFFPVFTLRIPLIFLLQSKAAICALTLHFRTITQSKLSVLIERDVCQTGVPLPLILLCVWVTDWIIN